MPDSTYTLREYTPADEPSWLRCRVLSFLATPYFDDVVTSKPRIDRPGFELLMADAGGEVAGIIDVAVEDGLATIDTIAVHPDHQRRGIGRALFDEALRRVRASGVPVLDAWTRDRPETLAWYRAMGFAESSHYLHVYANRYTDGGEPARAVPEPRADLRPVMLFMHAALQDEELMRRQFSRVHVCRRFSLAVGAPAADWLGIHPR
ncbi:MULTISPECIES: GNAT family N-acetyltransferase [Kitasatospora]|uniref:GNAT family N-acetyltransferase n=1 Tax=Kitasatospora TaxID=2063 RepID=UPI000C71349C|nr:GNAT family N-acetyltransferase [Kitasatospora sp. GP30]MDH6142165.1 ribosomal protein S18 acetylase RimI-like enzyme [Kitasatospora sp. GP30]